MDLADVVPILGEELAGFVVAGLVSERWVADVEGVLEVARGVLLWDEKGVEVPETGFDEAKLEVS